jgi:copper homeostasis protein
MKSSFMPFEIEVCIDNIESLPLAIEGGATRIELCSSLALGGLTPSFGMMKIAKEISTIPVYAMIRPRQGDFLFSNSEVDLMLEDVKAAKLAGLDGIVIGVLQANGKVNMDACRALMTEAEDLGVTFHRAIDNSLNYLDAIDDIIELGCERILTSGTAANALEGINIIKEMNQYANGRISIMAGAGLTHSNVAHITDTTGITEVHLSGKSTRPSEMKVGSKANMGSSDLDDFTIPVTNSQAISLVSDILGH